MLNPLGQRRYSINATVADIGWITDEERAAVQDAIGADGIAHFTSDLKQLHLYWPLLSDTAHTASSSGWAILHRAAEATGVPVPRITRFEVQEMGE